MQGRKAALFLAACLPLLSPAARAEALADALGDRIAERLCHPPSATRMDMTAIEVARLRAHPPVTGAYRDIQGADARAWFEVLQDGTARCRTPANSSMTLYFCAGVRLQGQMLVRKRKRLCELP